ncbi:MAG: DUF3299 domain-containing protein [Runella slithyformis]|nr:MAG: DUF3299 domain-containing protein [Runella slithyformis]TAF95449.1 MAG: DUF3299 domain-containing protein [Runella sp.]TAG21160.1 MAG: DUF3299 domain-containing protein [Cytophagales bacterium]TAG40254.1 MAG: DUF3299 domain-containing protein [Cytophagia bacterium]TAF02332.1 MAG: DUF3299 domain-containing protein [Runella slithyformis]
MKPRIVLLLALVAISFTSFVSKQGVDKFKYRPLTSANPVKITWESLRDVTFKKKWYPEESVYMLYPTFGPNINKLNGKEVLLAGYVLPIDMESNLYALSAFPFSACFFCGGAGPESVVSLKFKKSNRKFKTDERHTFKGVMRLNADNIYELNYILENAEIEKE